MPTEASSWFEALWTWAKANDLPNWFAVTLTAVLWPITLFLWQRRKVNNVPNLEVRFSESQIKIGSTPHIAIDIQVANHTGSVVYVSGARVRNCSAAFPVPPDAARDIAQNSYYLSFMDDSDQFVLREVTIQTNKSAKTCIAVSQNMGQKFFTYSAPWYCRIFRRRKYFVLEYTAMVGTMRYSVATLY